MVEAGLEARVLTLAQKKFHGRERLPGYGGRREVIREDKACKTSNDKLDLGEKKRERILARPPYGSKGAEGRRAGLIQRNGNSSWVCIEQRSHGEGPVGMTLERCFRVK